MQTVYLAHGFNVKDGGAGTTDRLRPYFEKAGYNVVEIDYLWSGLLGVQLCNKKLAMMLSRLAERDSIAVGHSNGCAILHAASLFGAKFEQMIYINPALDRDKAPGSQVSFLHVYHSPSDIPVTIAKYMPWHDWGDMGARGYSGSDPRVTNFNKEKDFPVVSDEHSDMFKSKLKLEVFTEHMVKTLKEHSELLQVDW